MTDSNRARSRVLYQRYHPALIAYFTRRIGSQDALGAADDVFVVAWRRLGEVPDDDEALLWLYGVARNVLSNRQRSARRYSRLLAHVQGTQPSSIEEPESEVLRHLDSQHVVEALSTLRAADQEVLLLSYWEGLTHVEIGTVLGCSKPAIDSRTHRALGRLRKALRQAGHEPVAGPSRGSAREVKP